MHAAMIERMVIRDRALFCSVQRKAHLDPHKETSANTDMLYMTTKMFIFEPPKRSSLSVARRCSGAHNLVTTVLIDDATIELSSARSSSSRLVRRSQRFARLLRALGVALVRVLGDHLKVVVH
jgi:hypothetical protein